MSPIIDIYCHIFPDRYFQEMTRVAPNLENIGKRLRGVTKLFDLDARFREMDEYGDYRQIISLPNPAIEDIATPGVGLNLARVANDTMGELCRKYPQRFPAFAAALCMPRPRLRAIAYSASSCFSIAAKRAPNVQGGRTSLRLRSRRLSPRDVGAPLSQPEAFSSASSARMRLTEPSLAFV